MTQTNLYQQYHAIRHQMDELAIQEQKLEEQILEELAKNPEPTVKNEWGNFTRRVSKRYSFSLDLLDKATKVEKKIKEYSQPLLDQIDSFAKPLRSKIEFEKQKEIDSGKAQESLSVTMAYAYKKQ